MTAAAPARPAMLLARVLLALAGGYAASAGFVATLAVALPTAGLARSEAATLSPMLGFVIYLVLLLWAFVERRLWALAAVLAMLAIAGFGVAHLVGPGG